MSARHSHRSAFGGGCTQSAHVAQCLRLASGTSLLGDRSDSGRRSGTSEAFLCASEDGCAHAAVQKAIKTAPRVFDAVNVGLVGAARGRSPPNEIGVHPRTPEIMLAEREARQPRASAEDRVVARGRGTDGRARPDRRSAGATSSYTADADYSAIPASRRTRRSSSSSRKRLLRSPATRMTSSSW